MLTLAYASDAEWVDPPDRQVNIWYDESGAMYARAFSRGVSHRIEWPGVGVFAFSVGSTQVRVSAAPGASHELIEDTFARLLQPIILQALGWQAIHASAVVGPSGVWAFCARSGSGKSTLAFAFGRAGFRQFADDALVLSLDGPDVMAHPVPFVPRLEAASRDYFSVETVGARQIHGTGDATRLGAIFLLRPNILSAAATSLTRLEPAPAFTALLAHAHCFDVDDRIHVKKLLSDYLALSESIPIFACSYCHGFAHLPELIDRIQEAGAGTSSPSRVRQWSLSG